MKSNAASVGLFVSLALLAAELVSTKKLTSVENVSKAPDDTTFVASTAQTKYMENIIPLMLDRALAGKVVEDWQMSAHVAKDSTQKDEASCFGSEDPSMIIISLVVKIPREYVEALRKNRLMVANAANYRYCQYSHALASDRDIAWSKVIAIRHLLDIQQKPVVWMDADAVFTSDKKFEDVTAVHFQTNHKDIVFTDDMVPGPDSINTGVLVTRSTAWTKKFWASVYKDFPEAISHPWWEQQAVILYKRKFAEDFAAHTAIVPHAVMNNVDHFSGQFIAHPAGGHGPGKYQRLLEVMKG